MDIIPHENIRDLSRANKKALALKIADTYLQSSTVAAVYQKIYLQKAHTLHSLGQFDESNRLISFIMNRFTENPVAGNIHALNLEKKGKRPEAI